MHIGTEYGVDYHYNATDGRFERVTGPGLPGYVDPGTPGYGVQYGRLASSDLLETASYKTDVNTTLVSTQRDYESNRDLIEWVDNKVGVTTVSKYNYNASNDDLDALGRRTSVVYTGTAFAENHLFKWGYNNRSELTTADRHQGTNPDSPGTQYPDNGDYEFNYDHIGNRQTYGLDADPDTTYTANDLNQYAGTTYPTEAFAYDFDGNLITDGTRLYQWDAENRLIVVEPMNPGANDKRVAFAYDYMGRRVRKQVFDWTGSAWSGTASTDLRFVYDGWNVVMVLDGLDSNAVTRKYTWGLDLSGTIHGAGGIGGLLACEEPQAPGGPKRYWFFYDANGNVGQVLNATDTNSITIAAHYEYDPYGNVINNLSSYTYATANPFRFSTKWFDNETSLGNWTFRYYSPRLGRWMSRDPIGEAGGRNLYTAVANSPLSWFDPDGAEATTQPPTTQSTIDNLDPNTHLGGLIAGAPPHQTTCGIYVVRKTLGGRQWPGHTFIMWPGGSLGFSAGGRIISEQSDTVRQINQNKLVVSIYTVDYAPSRLVVGSNYGGSTYTDRVGLAYNSGPDGVKGKCCPDQPNCHDLIACLASQVGTSVKGFEKNTVFTNPFYGSEVNCNSFARFALQRCCLSRGKLIVNGYTGAFAKYEPIFPLLRVGFNIYDDEGGNLWGWNNGPSGLRLCGCSERLR